MIFLPIFMFCLPVFSVATNTSPTPEEIIENWVNLIEPATSKCACESGASLGDIETLWDTFEYPRNNPCLMCYMRCIYREIGLSDSNDIPIEDIYVRLVLGTTEDIFCTCQGETNHIRDPCRRIYDFDICISRELNLL